MSKRSLLCVAAAFAFSTLPAWGQSKLPEGPAKEEIEANCNVCHTTDRIISSTGFDRKGWENVIDGMVNAGSPLPHDQIEMVVDYLTKNFPPKPMPPAVLVPGSVKVSIKEWTVPTPGSRPPSMAPFRDAKPTWASISPSARLSSLW